MCPFSVAFKTQNSLYALIHRSITQLIVHIFSEYVDFVNRKLQNIRLRDRWARGAPGCGGIVFFLTEINDIEVSEHRL